MGLFEALFDLIAILFATGLSAYGFKLYQLFRGGIMEKAFQVLATAPLLFVAGEVVDTLDALELIDDPMGVVHISLEVVFIALLFYSFYLLKEAWAIKR